MIDLVLVDISKIKHDNITCVKKNIYDDDLKYIAISYRWGEVEKQVVKTPDYTAHITSFDISYLEKLCTFIEKDPELKEIQYLWIDAISFNQQNHELKKETSWQIPVIYQRAAYILAIPDLHLSFLKKNPENKSVLDVIKKYSTTIYDELLSSGQSTDENKIEEEEEEKNDIKKVYRFLTYLVHDWSNRVWTISENEMAKEKKGIPLKYTFMSLMIHFPSHLSTPFFSYSFDHHDININNNNHKNNNLSYMEVDDGRKFIKFLKNILTQRSYLDMLLNSKASNNKDRFHAILPSWKKYRHVIKDKNTISNWQITNMVSVRLKLYEIMEDLWDKARLLYACSHHSSPGFPTFARYYDNYHIYLKEIDGIYTRFSFDPHGEYYYVKERKGFTTGSSLNNISGNEIDHSTKYALNSFYVPYEMKNEQIQINGTAKIKQFTNNVISRNIINAKIGDANLIDIQLNGHGKYGHPYLTVKSKFCFYYTLDKEVSDSLKAEYSLKDADHLTYVRIPFFIPGKTVFGGGNDDISDVYLLGDENKNIWIVCRRYLRRIDWEWTFVFVDGYTFNVY